MPVWIVGCNQLAGQVKWSSERRFGIALRERVSVTSLAEGGTKFARIARSVGVARRSASLMGTGLAPLVDATAVMNR